MDPYQRFDPPWGHFRPSPPPTLKGPPPNAGGPKERVSLETGREVMALPLEPAAGTDAMGVPRRPLMTGVRTVDRFLGGFRPGQVTLLRGLHHAPTLLPRLLVLAVLELDEDAVLVDGGNVADPYALSSVCRRLRVRPRDVLPRVHIARAFTSFQMSSILEDALPRAVEEHSPAVVAVSCVDELYHDDNVDRDQATVLLGRALDRVRDLTVDEGLVTLLADLRARPRGAMDRFSALLDARAHEAVWLERRSRRSMRLRRHDGETAVLASPPPGQLTLDDFLVGGVSLGAGTGEVLAPLPVDPEGRTRSGRWRFG